MFLSIFDFLTASHNIQISVLRYHLFITRLLYCISLLLFAFFFSSIHSMDWFLLFLSSALHILYSIKNITHVNLSNKHLFVRIRVSVYLFMVSQISPIQIVITHLQLCVGHTFVIDFNTLCGQRAQIK